MAKLKWGGALRGPGREYAEGFVEGLHNKLAQSRITNNPETTAIIVRGDEIARQKRLKASHWLRSEKGLLLGRNKRSFHGQHNDEARRDGRNDGANMKVSAARKKQSYWSVA